MTFNGSPKAQLNRFQSADLSVVDMKAKHGSDLMKTVFTGGAGVHVEEIVFFVGHYFQDVGMAADKKTGSMSYYLFVGFRKIVSGIASYVGNKYFEAFAFENEILRM